MNGIANKPGAYENFSGTIDYKATECIVKDATFEILEHRKSYKGVLYVDIIFHGGDVVSGKLCNANIEYCNFYGELLRESIFHSGTFKSGKFRTSYWFDGVWCDAKWECAFDRFGRNRFYPPPFNMVNKIDGIIRKPGRYKDYTGWVDYGESKFYIEDGELEIQENKWLTVGNACYTYIYGGTITKGNVYDTIVYYANFNGNKMYNCGWRNGVFNGKQFLNSCWFDGKWTKGMFEDSRWKDGIWESGTWEDSIWDGGFDKNGIYHKKYDSPNKWKI